MVFFTCNACGESLKKAQIQKHTGMCRGARVFSCIDCGKDFRGDDYKNHVKCITEDQKYGGKNYEAKANKGDVKQQQWIERIQEALNKPGVNARLKSVLQQVAAYDNVPRKKAKFQNWMKNSLRIYDSGLQDQVWDIFSSSTDTTETNGVRHANAEQQAEQTAPAMPEPEVEEKADKKKKNKRERKEERQQKGKKGRMDNGNVEDQQNGAHGAEQRGKKKKRKRMEEGEHEEEKPNKIKKKKKEEESEESPNTEEVQDEQEVQEEANTKGKFNWKGTIKAVLRQAPEEGISLKKLRKKVITEYYSFTGDENHKSDEELYSLFNKKLNNPKFRMVKDKVRLIK